MERIINRIKGTIYGQAIGDALGLGTEGMTDEDMAWKYPNGIQHYSDIFQDRHRKRWNLFEPIGLDYGDDIMVPRGKAWQHFVMEQNEALLPEMDSIYKSVIDNPDNVEEMLINMGRTLEVARRQIQILRNEIQDLDDIQEIRAHLKTWFKSDVMPYLKDPNSVSEIESAFEDIPTILESRPDKVKRVMETVRPGNLKEYAKYFAESLSMLPFVYSNSKNE